MRRLAIVGLAFALIGNAAYAGFCERDAVPAATLLVPYAVVGLDANNAPDPNSYTTILDVTNLSNQKQIIHVTVWDTLGSPVIAFDEVLSGYDVWQINFRDLLTGSFNLFDTGDYDHTDNGSGPKPAANPPYPEIGDFWKGTLGTVTSPWAGPAVTGFPSQYGPSTNSIFMIWEGNPSYPPGGPAPQLPRPQDIDYPTPANTGCNFPYGPMPGVGATIVALLQAAILPGLAPDSSECLSTCGGSPEWLATLGDNPAFFYATVDVVTGCSQSFPSDPEYWSPTAFATVHNVIAGNTFYLSPAGNFSESVPAVSIEADLDWASPTPHAGFYSQHTENFATPVHDFHEPLPTAYAFEYYNGNGITSNLMLWKNTTELELCKGVPCAWTACSPYLYYAWDQNENCKARGGGGPVDPCTPTEPNTLPFYAQRVPLTPANFDGIPATSGWMLLVFDPSILGTTYGTDPSGSTHLPLGNGTRDAQAWVGAQYYWGTYSTSVEATTVGNFWCNPTDVMPALGTYDGVLDGSLRR